MKFLLPIQPVVDGTKSNMANDEEQECKGFMAMHNIKGLGLVADGALQRGDEVVADTTYFATDWNCGDVRSFEDEDLLFAKFSKWSFQQAVLYFKSRYHVIADKSIPMTSLRSSQGLRTLSPLRKKQLKLAVVGIWVSNINHGCKPNAHLWIDSARKAAVITAVGNIKPGEEITISYLDMSFPVSRRDQVASQSLFFTCHCDLCCHSKLHPGNRRVDEEKYGELEKWMVEMMGWNGRLDFHKIKSSPEALLENFYLARRFFRQEEIWDQRIAGGFEHGFCVVAYHGDQGRAAQFARVAYGLRKILKGPNSHDVKILEKLKDNPTSWEHFGSESTWTAPLERVLAFEPHPIEEFWAKLFMVGEGNGSYSWADIKSIDTVTTETANPKKNKKRNNQAKKNLEDTIETEELGHSKDEPESAQRTIAQQPTIGAQHDRAFESDTKPTKEGSVIQETAAGANTSAAVRKKNKMKKWYNKKKGKSTEHQCQRTAEEISEPTEVFEDTGDEIQEPNTGDDEPLFLTSGALITTKFTSSGKLVIEGTSRGRVEVTFKQERGETLGPIPLHPPIRPRREIRRMTSSRQAPKRQENT
jgi:hypothetical protein